MSFDVRDAPLAMVCGRCGCIRGGREDGVHLVLAQAPARCCTAPLRTTGWPSDPGSFAEDVGRARTRDEQGHWKGDIGWRDEADIDGPATCAGSVRLRAKRSELAAASCQLQAPTATLTCVVNSNQHGDMSPGRAK